MPFATLYGAELDGELAGVAAWLPPGAFPLSTSRQPRAVPHLVRTLVAAPRSARRLLHHLQTGIELHPKQPPHWYRGLDVPDVLGVGRVLASGPLRRRLRVAMPELGVGGERFGVWSALGAIGTVPYAF
jgi:hypothetical protein